MKIVLDTNVVFSGLIAGGVTRRIIIAGNPDLFVPEYFFSELEKYRERIKEKSGQNGSDLNLLINLLFEQINIVPKTEFNHLLSRAEELIEDTDPDDVPFLALALHLDADIWSDDEDFQKQEEVEIWRTEELIEELGVE